MGTIPTLGKSDSPADHLRSKMNSYRRMADDFEREAEDHKVSHARLIEEARVYRAFATQFLNAATQLEASNG